MPEDIVQPTLDNISNTLELAANAISGLGLLLEEQILCEQDIRECPLLSFIMRNALEIVIPFSIYKSTFTEHKTSLGKLHDQMSQGKGNTEIDWEELDQFAQKLDEELTAFVASRGVARHCNKQVE